MNLTRQTAALFVLIAGSLLLPATAPQAKTPEKDDIKPVLARIALLEQTRKIERTAWRKFIRHDNATVRAAAVRGLGRTQDTRGMKLIKEAMEDGDVGVRMEAIFAYGQLPKGKLAPLVKRLEVESDLRVRESLVEAMGKRAGLGDIPLLVSLADGKSAALAGRALSGLGLLARREKVALPVISGKRIADWLGHEDVQVRFGAAYLLLRAEKMVDAEAFAATARAAQDTDPEIRAMAMRAGGRFEQGGALRKAALTDSDWRVRVEALRAAAKRKEVDLIGLAMETHVAALIEGVAPPSTEELQPGLTAANMALKLPVAEATTAVAKKLFEASRTGRVLITDRKSVV